jgi:pSer/pThr/pTyr-binding forkhead associated (FHA) protein
MKVGCLDIFAGEDAGKRILLKNLSVFEAGRSPGNHICLKDPSVAMSHFRICRDASGYSIYDLGTRKGTFLNGARIEKADLHPGDVVQVGEMQLAFLLVDEDSRGRLACSAPDSKEKDSQAVHGGVLTKTRASMPALVVLDGRDRGKRFTLSGKSRYTIGGGAQADLKLADDHVSPEHCAVEAVEGGHIIIDLEGAGGTVVNGESVKRAVLREGHFIRLGHTMLRYDRV